MQISCTRATNSAVAFILGPHSIPALALVLRGLHRCSTAAARLLRLGALAALAIPLGCSGVYAKNANSNAITASRPYAAFIADASQRFVIPASWLRAVIHVESAENPKAVSPKGAMGLMQLMPTTWSALRMRYHLGNDPFDPHDNILGGAAYLRELLNRFGAPGFLAAYNAGPKRFEDYRTGRRPLHDETRRYLSRVAQMLPDLPIGSTMRPTLTASDWHSAGLFTSQPTSSSPSNRTRSSSPANDRSSPDSFVLAPQSNGLFVPVRKAAQ